MNRHAIFVLVAGVAALVILLAIAEVIDRTPGGMHPTWRPAPSATPASVPAPRMLRTATQGAP